MKGKDLSNTIIMEPIGDISDPENLNPDILGFMCGLEIHQQLDTGKLHSRMPSKLFDYKFDLMEWVIQISHPLYFELLLQLLLS